MKWLTDNFMAARGRLGDEIARFRNRDFMEAVIAGCAVVATADGEVSASEKQKMVDYIKNSPELKVFDLKDVIRVFNDFCDKFTFDHQIGLGEAMRAISKIKDKPGAGQLLVRVCCAIASADGNFDDHEKAAIISICHVLGLNPKDFDL